MPLVLEEDARSGNCFDPATASTLYWKQVPVLVKQHDREDQTEQLTFRILSGTTRQNHSLRVSLQQVTAEDWRAAGTGREPTPAARMRHGAVWRGASTLPCVRVGRGGSTDTPFYDAARALL